MNLDGFILILSSFLVAHFIGRRRQIGFLWAFVLCLSSFCIGGLILTLLSRKSNLPSREPDNFIEVSGYMIIVVGILLEISVSPERRAYFLKNEHDIGSFKFFYEDTISLLFFLLAAIYIILVGKGKRFDF